MSVRELLSSTNAHRKDNCLQENAEQHRERVEQPQNNQCSQNCVVERRETESNGVGLTAGNFPIVTGRSANAPKPALRRFSCTS